MNRQITYIQKLWLSRKIQEDAKKLQKASESMNMTPIWKYTKLMRHNNKNSHHPIKKLDGTHTKNAQEEIERWQEYIKEQFYIDPETTTPKITHITENQWGTIDQQKEQAANIPDTLQHIRKHSQLAQLNEENEHIHTWLTTDYTEAEVKKAIMGLKNNKAHGSDGIPGEVFKILRQHMAKPITKIMNKIKNKQKCQKNGYKVQ